LLWLGGGKLLAQQTDGLRIDQWEHPTPRRGITAANVAADDDLHDWPDALPAFRMVRTIPHIIDGIRCHCGCADVPDHYSLLSCFEGSAMAKGCSRCQSQAAMAYSGYERGKSLAAIRSEIDAQFA
jgi:hypothetical protein